MTESQWTAFSCFREKFLRQCQEWNRDFCRLLEPLQQEACRKDTPEYPVETSVVYNQALDQVTADSQIRLMVIGDNPGKDEQRLCNQRYLVGQAGKLAAGFFARNPELGIDFRRDTIILNKTPVHTAKTAHLRHLLKSGVSEIRNLIGDSQVWMARETAALHQALVDGSRADGGQSVTDPCQLWLVGYGDLKGRGLFLGYRDELARCYQVPGQDASRGMVAAWNQVKVYQHFSMNRFTIDLAESVAAGRVDHQLPLQEQLAALGLIHRQEIFGL